MESQRSKEKDLPESSLNSSHLLFPPAPFLLSSEEELDTLESSEDESSSEDSFAAQKRDMLDYLIKSRGLR
jgi:hypothetical protein